MTQENILTATAKIRSTPGIIILFSMLAEKQFEFYGYYLTRVFIHQQFFFVVVNGRVISQTKFKNDFNLRYHSSNLTENNIINKAKPDSKSDFVFVIFGRLLTGYPQKTRKITPRIKKVIILTNIAPTPLKAIKCMLEKCENTATVV